MSGATALVPVDKRPMTHCYRDFLDFKPTVTVIFFITSMWRDDQISQISLST